MKKITLIPRLCSITLAVSMAAAALEGCHSSVLNPLSQENLDKVHEHMSAEDVKAILGEPTTSKTEPIPIVGGTKTTYTYDNGKDQVVIIFKNDDLQTKEGSFSNQ